MVLFAVVCFDTELRECECQAVARRTGAADVQRTRTGTSRRFGPVAVLDRLAVVSQIESRQPLLYPSAVESLEVGTELRRRN